MDIKNYVKNNRLGIIVKPNSPKNEVVSYDASRNALRVNIAAPADKNKANIKIISFFSKLLKKKVRIKSGLKSKEKLLEIE